MQKAGINVVRLAEFAWSKLEPEDDVYDFDWLDEVMDILNKRGAKVILCTPTAAPPIWPIEKHPHILPLLRNGQCMAFGAMIMIISGQTTIAVKKNQCTANYLTLIQ